MLTGGHEANPAPAFAWDTLLSRVCEAEGESGLGVYGAVDGTHGLSPESPNIADTTLCSSPNGSWALSCAWPARPWQSCLFSSWDWWTSRASLLPAWCQGRWGELCEF